MSVPECVTLLHLNSKYPLLRVNSIFQVVVLPVITLVTPVTIVSRAKTVTRIAIVTTRHLNNKAGDWSEV